MVGSLIKLLLRNSIKHDKVREILRKTLCLLNTFLQFQIIQNQSKILKKTVQKLHLIHQII